MVHYRHPDSSPHNSTSISFVRAPQLWLPSAKEVIAARQALFHGSEGTDAYNTLAAKVEEGDGARRAAIPILAALRKIDTRISKLTRREAKLTTAAARHRAELEATEADLGTLHTELAAANAAGRAAAARVAIPCAHDKADIDIVAHSTIQTLSRVGEIAGPSANANVLREHLQRSADLIRLLADEAAIATAAAPAAQRAGQPADTHTDFVDDQDMEPDEATEEDLRIAPALLQTELDAPDIHPDDQRAASSRASLRILAKRPRKLGGAAVSKQHLKGKGRAAPAAAPPSS